MVGNAPTSLANITHSNYKFSSLVISAVYLRTPKRHIHTLVCQQWYDWNHTKFHSLLEPWICSEYPRPRPLGKRHIGNWLRNIVERHFEVNRRNLIQVISNWLLVGFYTGHLTNQYLHCESNSLNRIYSSPWQRTQSKTWIAPIVVNKYNRTPTRCQLFSLVRFIGGKSAKVLR